MHQTKKEKGLEKHRFEDNCRKLFITYGKADGHKHNSVRVKSWPGDPRPKPRRGESVPATFEVESNSSSRVETGGDS